MSAYYNEHDAFAAQWLRNLIAAGHIAPGDVDERSIRDVSAADLMGYRQCHFFAGIGVWSHALRSAGWADDREVWTGSCPCQPFSAAGKQGGFADERHLWPEFFRLISERRPHVVFGEQVASPDGLAWLDAVSSDMEGAGYAFGAVDTCAAGCGAPHIRQRLYFVAESASERYVGRRTSETSRGAIEPERSRDAGGMADTGLREHRGRYAVGDPDSESGSAPGAVQGGGRERVRELHDVADGGAVVLGDTDDAGLQGLAGNGDKPRGREVAAGPHRDASGTDNVLVDTTSEQVGLPGCTRQPRSTNGRWADVEWLPCQDGKSRPAQPGTFPLAHGATQRVGRLRAYGNALVASQAEEFVRAYTGATVRGEDCDDDCENCDIAEDCEDAS